MNNPTDIRNRVIKAAVAVNKCVAEFDAGSCGEHFDELSAAVYELERFNDDVFLIEQKLDFIAAATKEFGQPTRSYMVEQEISIIRKTLERWKQ